VKQRVNAMVAEIQVLRGKGNGSGPETTLMNLINQASQTEGLPITRLQPSSKGELQVRFEGVAFNNVAQFLYALEIEQGVIVKEVNLSQSDTGVVAATIRLAQGG
jgi:type II secretory pathway component PulM